MIYHFNTEYAKEYGVDEAILIQNFIFWIAKNKANNKHQHDGRTWTYNSYDAFAELFDFWSKSQIKRRINSLVEQGVIVKGNYNDNAYNHTTWYAFKDEKAFVQNDMNDETKSSDQGDGSVSSSYNTDNKPDSNKGYTYEFEKFWDLYDKKTGKKKSFQKWQKLDEKDKANIMEFIPKYKEAEPDPQYRKNPTTFFNNRSWEDEYIQGQEINNQQSILDQAMI